MYEWSLYNGSIIVHFESMKRISNGRPKSSHFHNEMDIRNGKTFIVCGLCKQSGHNRRSCQNRNKVDKTM